MKVHRAGTNRNTKDRLRRHNDLMKQYIDEGMAVDEASERAFKELFGRVPNVTIKLKKEE